MKLNKRLLPWFIAAELSVIIVFSLMLACTEMSDSFCFFAAGIPFMLAFAGKCAEIKDYHPKLMPLLIGIPAAVSAVILLLGIIKDVAYPPFGSPNFAEWYFAPFLTRSLLPAIIISAVMEIIIFINRKRSGYFFDETDTVGVKPCIVIVAATAFLCYFSAWEIKYQISLHSNF